MTFEKIRIEDKPYFDKLLSGKNYFACEYCFTNFFIWQDTLSIERAIKNDSIFVRGIYKNKRFYFYPISDKIDEALEMLLDLEGKNLEIACAFDSILDKTSKEMLERFTFTKNISLSDYVYRAEDLIKLEGKKYHQKRNHLTKFKNSYSYEFIPMSAKDTAICIDMKNRWAAEKEMDGPDLERMNNESKAIELALQYFNELELSGGIIKIEGSPQSFAIGEIPNKPNKKIGIVHFEKADYNFTGIFQAINQMFSQYAFSNVEFINRQDDMGLPGLKKAKESYHPIMMINKTYMKPKVCP